MAEKEVWLGSVGPFIFDDGDVYPDGSLINLCGLRTNSNVISTETVTLTNIIIGDGSAGVNPSLDFDGEDNDGSITWMEDEDYFRFDDDVLIPFAEKLYFRDTAIHIGSATDGHLDLTADTLIDFNSDAIVESGYDLFFRDSAISIGSDDDGHLDLDADTQIDLNQNTAVTGWLSVSVRFYANGQTGQTGSGDVITQIRDNAGTVEYKKRTLTFTGGLVTNVGAESGWTAI